MKGYMTLIVANLIAASIAAVALNLDDGSPILTHPKSVPVTHVAKRPDLLFPHGDMSDADAIKAWKTTGRAKLALDRQIYVSPPSSLRIDVDDPAGGVASYELVPVDNSVEITGKIRASGSARGTLFVRMKDGLAPMVVLAHGDLSSLAPRPGTWSQFRFTAKFPTSYYGAQLVLQASSHGQIWLDDITTTRVK